MINPNPLLRRLFLIAALSLGASTPSLAAQYDENAIRQAGDDRIVHMRHNQPFQFTITIRSLNDVITLDTRFGVLAQTAAWWINACRPTIVSHSNGSYSLRFSGIGNIQFDGGTIALFRGSVLIDRDRLRASY